MTPTQRPGNWRDVLVDVAPAIGLLAVGMLDIATGLTDPTGPALPTTAIVPVIVVCIALLFRRRWPTAVFAVIVLTIVVPAWLGSVALTYWGEFIPWCLSIYSVARHERLLWRPLVALGASALTLAAISLRFPEMADPGDVLYNGAFLAGAWCLGLFAKSWAAYRDNALRLEIERVQAVERAGLLERARIARELHDVIAHTITVVVMQAGGARLAAAQDPSAAVAALAQIETLGRDSLTELRALLTVLRGSDEEPDGTAPLPTLADLDGLCERMRRLGLPVTLHSHSALDAIPLGIQLTAYRVVQEGLTNVLKHSGTVDTDVTVDRSERGDELLVEVSSRTGAVTPRLPGARRGLTGLRERVELAGGTMTTRHVPDGGFLLQVGLPIPERST